MENFVLQISSDGGKTYKMLICEPYKAPIRKAMKSSKERARYLRMRKSIAIDGIIVSSLTN